MPRHTTRVHLLGRSLYGLAKMPGDQDTPTSDGWHAVAGTCTTHTAKGYSRLAIAGACTHKYSTPQTPRASPNSHTSAETKTTWGRLIRHPDSGRRRIQRDLRKKFDCSCDTNQLPPPTTPAAQEKLPGLVQMEGAIALVDGHEEARKDQGNDGHQLHHNVQRRAGRVLQGIANRVADNGGLVCRAAPTRNSTRGSRQHHGSTPSHAASRRTCPCAAQPPRRSP